MLNDGQGAPDPSSGYSRAIRLRTLDRDADAPQIRRIDTAFETPSVYSLSFAADRIDLVLQPLPSPRTKRYAIGELFEPWCSWDAGWVIEDPQICAVAAVEYEPWHRRLVLWHLYVDRTRRREGFARRLLDQVEAHGREVGATRVWLETSTVNVPGIAAYGRLGYTLCGVDSTYYEGTAVADEAAVYLSKPLT